MKSEIINWGIVGCGWVARDFVAPGIIGGGNSRLVAACDLNLENLHTIAPSEDNVLRTTDLNVFLNCRNLNAVYIATPNDSHRFITEQAAQKGKHVLCEKPMATTLTDAAAMVAVCRENAVQYGTAFDQRYHARHQKLREIVAGGELGAITIAKIHYACWLPADWCADNWRVDPRRAGGGAFIDLAPHGIDLLQYLLDDEFVEFNVMLQRRVFDYAVDDGAAAMGRFSSGALAMLNVAYNCPETFPRRTLEIIGTRGRALAVNTMGQTPGGSLYVTSANGEEREIAIEADEDVSPFQRQVEMFSACLLAGEPFPFPPERDLKTMKILTQRREDARAQRDDEKFEVTKQ